MLAVDVHEERSNGFERGQCNALTVDPRYTLAVLIYCPADDQHSVIRCNGIRIKAFGKVRIINIRAVKAGFDIAARMTSTDYIACGFGT